ncbi:hypothetical protein SADUNF_Sadunf17G0067000 [Salix dunnii]|uniref:Uncharacterized protein n=1 Tax=Salix dunnii TaxID=1413687 RepID=A0A835J2W9_9ROSI|nr:hypothetical protein SADUNF_Sadunf17G0067000 [Salix dunnii]
MSKLAALKSSVASMKSVVSTKSAIGDDNNHVFVLVFRKLVEVAAHYVVEVAVYYVNNVVLEAHRFLHGSELLEACKGLFIQGVWMSFVEGSLWKTHNQIVC